MYVKVPKYSITFHNSTLRKEKEDVYLSVSSWLNFTLLVLLSNVSIPLCFVVVSYMKSGRQIIYNRPG